MNENTQPLNENRQLIFFDLSRTVFDTFHAGNMLAIKYWNEKFIPNLKKELVEAGLMDKSDTTLELFHEDLTAEKYSERQPFRLYTHNIYGALNAYRNHLHGIKHLSLDELQALGNRICNVYDEILDKKAEELALKLPNETEKIVKLYDILKKFKKENFGEITITEKTRKAASGNSHTYDSYNYEKTSSHLTLSYRASLEDEFYHDEVLQLMQELKEQGHYIGIVTRNVRQDPEVPGSVFRSNSKLREKQYGLYGEPNLIFTREDGDKKRYNDEEKGLPKLIESIRRRLSAYPEITEGMIENAVMIGDMPHDGMVAAGMKWDWIQVTYGQDSAFLKNKKNSTAISQAGAAVKENGDSHLVADDYGELRNYLTNTLNLLPNSRPRDERKWANGI